MIKPSEVKEVIYGRPEGISGISLEVVDGGVMEDILISGVVMDGPEVPLFIRLGNRARPHMAGIDAPGVGKLGDIEIENIVVRNAGQTGCSITGIPGYRAKNISIRNLRLHFRGGVEAAELSDSVPELESLYPEATMFGTLPASVFYLRHLEEVNISEIQVEFAEADGRDHLVLDDVSGFRQKGIRIGSGEVPGIKVNKKRDE